MALRPINTLKSWFMTGLKPLQDQFHDWMDSFWHKEETIPQSAVSGLADSLNEKADAAAVVGLTPVVLSGSESSANHSTEGGTILHKVRVKSTALMANFKIGTTNGGSEILPDDNVPSGVVGIYTLDFDIENPTTIYFSGLAGTWSIKLIFQ